MVLFGCSTKPPSPPSPPRISDSFAKSALKALDTIAANTTQARVTDALSNADAEATNGDETALTKKLNSIYEQHRDNESLRGLLEKVNEGKSREYMYDQPYRRNYQRGRRNLESKVLEMDRRETACYKSFSDLLRNRSVLAPKECDSVEVEINMACYEIFRGPRAAPPPKECDLP